MKLFVLGLPPTFTGQDLHKLFESYGTVIDAKVISDRETGRSRGFGFVTFSNEEEAHSAMQNLDDSQPDGFNYPMKVSVAKDRNHNKVVRDPIPKSMKDKAEHKI